MFRRSVVLRAGLAAMILAAGAVPDGRSHADPATSTPEIAGWIERALLVTANGAMALSAKLDTGARTVSLHAPGFRVIAKKGQRWAEFDLADGEGRSLRIEAPVRRMVRIRRAGTETVERPVIELTLCVAGHTAAVEVTLADRGTMDYPMLIGRNFLSGRLLVDSGRTFIASRACALPD